MYSLNVMVCPFLFNPKGTQLTDINCQRGEWKISWLVLFERHQQEKKKKCQGEERHQHNNILSL